MVGAIFRVWVVIEGLIGVCYNQQVLKGAPTALNNPLLSVIIPVYNTRDMLPRALDSILSQGIDSLEIILVDDGSPDDSLSVCQSYAQRDARIRVVSRKNGGPGAARNTGLQLAQGYFIAFPDSDDTVTPGAYQMMLKAAERTDLVIGHLNILMHRRVFNRGYINDDRILNRNEFLDALAVRPGSHYYSSLCNKMYIRSIIQDNKIEFDSSLLWGEDLLFNLRYFYHIQQVAYVSQPVYNYKRTMTGQTWGTVMRFGAGLQIKGLLYDELKALYVMSGAFKSHRYHIYRYIFNVTYSK